MGTFLVAGYSLNLNMSLKNEKKLILLLTISPVSKMMSQNEVVCFCLATNLCVRPQYSNKNTRKFTVKQAKPFRFRLFHFR